MTSPEKAIIFTDIEAPEDLLEIKVLATMMDGVIRHRDGI